MRRIEISTFQKLLNFWTNLLKICFEKMLLIRYMLTRRVEREKKLSGISIDIRKEIINDFRNYFEFELTNDQLTSLEQVLNDLSKSPNEKDASG